MSHTIIETQGMTKSYPMGTGQIQALRGVDLGVEAGEFVALMGASGSGKSSLLHLLGCLDRPTSGIYRLEGNDVGRLTADERARVRNRRIGFIFQNFNLLASLTALENVMLPLLYGSAGRGKSGEVQNRATTVLQKVGLAARAEHRPTEMSGGERQRVAIARALVTDPAIVLADEPTGALDSVTGRDIMELMVGLCAGGRTILVVTHDAQVAAYAGRVLHMRDGRIVDD